MIIFFLRHGSSGQKLGNTKLDDQRPLDKQGVEQCRYIGRALAAADMEVDAIISSPLKRATQSASLVGNELGFEGSLRTEPALRPDGQYAAFRKMLQNQSKLDAIMVVGHNPSLSEFCSALLTGGLSAEVLDLKKGAVASVEYSGKEKAVLNWCITPKLVRALQSMNAPKSRRKPKKEAVQ